MNPFGPSPDLRSRWSFFYRHGTARVGWHAADALALARAEQWRYAEEDAGRLRVRWEWDECPYEMGDNETEAPAEVLVCIVQTRTEADVCECSDMSSCRCHGWKTADSLCGIGDPDCNYRRAVEAQLCLEAMAEADEAHAWACR